MVMELSLLTSWVVSGILPPNLLCQLGSSVGTLRRYQTVSVERSPELDVWRSEVWRCTPQERGLPTKRMLSFFKKIFIYLFLERGEGREEERKRNIDQLPLVCPPTWGPNMHPRPVP